MKTSSKTKLPSRLLAGAALAPLLVAWAANAAAPGPSILFLSPTAGASVGPTETIRVQVYDADGLAATNPVLVGVDVTAATPMTENLAIRANYCNVGSANFPSTVCRIFEYTPPVALAAGAHTLNVQATDATPLATTKSLAVTVGAAGTGSILRRTNSSQICQDCHALQTHASQYNSTAYGSWGNECQVCHTPHGTSNIYLVRPTITTPNSGAKSVVFQNTTGVAANSYGTPTASGNGVNICEVCHTQTRNGDGTARARNNAPTDWTKHYSGDCIACHAHSGGFGSSGAESGGGNGCSTCHKTIWDGMNGTTAGLLTRHSLGNVAATNAAFTDSGISWATPTTAGTAAFTNASATVTGTGTAWTAALVGGTIRNNATGVAYTVTAVASATSLSIAPAYLEATTASVAYTILSPLSGNTAAARSCVNMCHQDHVHNAVGQTTATAQHMYNTYTDASTNASTATRLVTRAGDGSIATGSPNNTDYVNSGTGGLCLSCHRTSVDATHPAIDQAPYQAGAHNYSSFGAYPTWQYNLHDSTAFLRNCTKCHADPADARPADGSTPFAAVHYSTNQSLLIGSTNPNGAAATFVCYQCHGGGTTGADLSGKAVFQDAGKASRHPTDADNVHNTVTEVNNAAWGNTLGVTGRHVNCQDCHAPHEAQTSAPLPTYATGTATATSGSGAVTGTGTTWTASMVGWWIKNNTVGVWHKVTAFTSATAITISPAATAAWAGNYTMLGPQNFYNLGTATFTSASTAVTGVGTSWTNAFKGWSIRSTTGTLYTIASVSGPTSLTLTTNYATATLTSAYAIAAGNLAGPGLAGAWGAQLASNPALFTAPTATNFAKKTVAVGTDLEATVCFKCHSSWYWGAGTPPNSISPNGTVATPVETDVAMEFNPNNKSGHPVLASLNNFAGSTGSKALRTTDMTAPWDVAVGTQTMSCSDCHNTDAASPAAQGPHGSAVAFMIKNGTAKPGWPTASANTAGFATTFCSDCHTLGGIHTTEGAHQTNCYRCHIVVPHGGKMSRLIGDRDAASAMPSRYAYSNDKTTMYIQSFTKGTAGSYSKSNCQASCTTEHNTAATENW